MGESGAAASAILTVHRQGRILVPTLRSILAARRHAAQRGYEVEIVIVADRCDRLTRSIIDQFDADLDVVLETDLGDPGSARQAGVMAATGRFVFFHDADDLYSHAWYAKFLDFVTPHPEADSAIFHGQIMIGFGEEFYYRQQTSSRDPGFDPMALTCQWYFATNLMAPRQICLDFPIPAHNARTGLGHDDWAWACNTLAAGIPRLVVPGAISFYREKPVGQGVGKVPGIIHPRSPLFDPAQVRDSTARLLAQHHAGSPFPFGSGFDGRNRAGEGFVPDWVMDEVHAQSAYEPMLSDLYDIQRAPRMFRALPLQSHVGLAYRDLCEHIDERPKVVISVTEKHLVAADLIVAETVRSLRAQCGDSVQIICLVEGDKFQWSREIYRKKYDVLMLDITKFKNEYRLADWYFYRFMMRFYTQFALTCVLDFGSDFFQRLFDEFHRPICALAPDIRFVYGLLHDDAINPAGINIVRNIELVRTASPLAPCVMSFSEDYFHRIAVGGCVGAALSAAERQYLRDAAVRRFAADAAQRVASLSQLSLGSFLRRPSQQLAAPPPRPDSAAVHPASVRFRPRDRAVAICAGGGVFVPGLMSQAQEMFAAEPGLEVLIPQVIFWADRSGRRLYTWLEPHGIPAQIEGCIDLMLLHGAELPIFALFRGAGPVYRGLKQLQSGDREIASHVLLRGLYAMSQDNSVKLIKSAVCVARQTRLASVRDLEAEILVH